MPTSNQLWFEVVSRSRFREWAWDMEERKDPSKSLVSDQSLHGRHV